MVYVLMAVVNFGTPSAGGGSFSQEFNSLGTCEAAGQALKQADGEVWAKFKTATYVFYRCVPK